MFLNPLIKFVHKERNNQIKGGRKLWEQNKERREFLTDFKLGIYRVVVVCVVLFVRYF